MTIKSMFLYGIAVAAGSAVLVAGSLGTSRDAGPGGAAGAETATAQPAVLRSDLALGLQVFAMWRDYEDHPRLLDEVVESGARWVRIDIGWCSLEEAGPGQVSAWYETRLDEVVTAARSRGLSILATLTCSPTWARADGQTRALPDDPAGYGRAARYLAERYRGEIAAWEMWNEPDCQNVGCGNGSPEEYVPVLREGYRGIKAGDSGATVLSGGLSGINLEWIRRMLDAGAGQYLDALALNPYIAPSNAPPETPPTAGFTDGYRLTNAVAAHALMTEYGLADVPIWLTEFGWSTGRTPGSVYDGVSRATQADYLTRAVAQIESDYPFVTHAFWFTLRDRDDASNNENGFGLLDLDGSEKPSYRAFAEAVARTSP